MYVGISFLSYCLLLYLCFRCYSRVGREYYVPGAQEVSIGPGCNSKGIILHEIMHALGFWHEQSRTDRDNFLSVLWENIKPGRNLWCIECINTLVNVGTGKYWHW